MKLLHKIAVLAIVFSISDAVNAQNFIPTSNIGSSDPNDITNDPPEGNVGIGFYSHYPYPLDPLTVGGDISLFPEDDGVERNIWGRTDGSIFSLYSGINNLDGSAIRLYGAGNSNSGLVKFISYNFNTSGVGFTFDHYNANAGGGFVSSLVIDKYARARIGNAAPFTSDRLTVDGSVYVYDPADRPRGILARSSVGSLDLFSGSTLSDGTSVNLFASNHGTNKGRMFFNIPNLDGANFKWRSVNGSTPSDRMVLDGNGLLHLSNHIKFDLASQYSWNYIQGYKSTAVLAVMANTGSNDGSGIEFNGSSTAGNPGSMALFVNGDNPGGTGFDFVKYASGSYTSMMNIQKNGKVRIGSSSLNTSSNNYTLFVEKGIMTEKIRVAVKTSNDWQDAVFNSDYNLRSLEEVSSYIKENKHLPDIPSADEVVENGIDLGEMNALLLKKIEELTLYMLQQQKEIDGLKTAIAKQR